MFRSSDVILAQSVRPLKDDPAFIAFVKVLKHERDAYMQIMARCRDDNGYSVDYNRGVFAVLLSLTEAIDYITVTKPKDKL